MGSVVETQTTATEMITIASMSRGAHRNFPEMDDDDRGARSSRGTTATTDPGPHRRHSSSTRRQNVGHIPLFYNVIPSVRNRFRSFHDHAHTIPDTPPYGNLLVRCGGDWVVTYVVMGVRCVPTASLVVRMHVKVLLPRSFSAQSKRFRRTPSGPARYLHLQKLFGD